MLFQGRTLWAANITQSSPVMYILAQNQSYDTQAGTLTLGHKVPPEVLHFHL